MDRQDRDLDPLRCRAARHIVDYLHRLRAADGSTSYREVTARVNKLRRNRRIPDRAAVATVHDCFKRERKRLDRDLVLEIAEALGLGRQGLVRLENALLIAAERAEESTRADVRADVPDGAEAFVGRAEELGKVSDLVAARWRQGRGAVVAVLGPAGIGKTELALASARRFGDAETLQLFADLHGFDAEQDPVDSDAVLAAFLRMTGSSRTQVSGLRDRAAKRERLRELLAGRRATIVLDNVAEPAAALLPQLGPGQAAVATSRDRAAAQGADLAVELGRLDRDEGVEVLRKLAASGRVDADPAAAARLSDLCGGVPFDLATLGGQLADPAMAEWTLSDHERRLSRLSADETIRPVLSTSYHGLPSQTRRLFRILAALPSSTFTPYEAAAVSDASVDDARRRLRLLHNRFLLTSAGAERWRYHDISRAFACWLLDRHEPASSLERAMRRISEVATRGLASPGSPR